MSDNSIEELKAVEHAELLNESKNENISHVSEKSCKASTTESKEENEIYAIVKTEEEAPDKSSLTVGKTESISISSAKCSTLKEEAVETTTLSSKETYSLAVNIDNTDVNKIQESAQHPEPQKSSEENIIETTKSTISNNESSVVDSENTSSSSNKTSLNDENIEHEKVENEPPLEKEDPCCKDEYAEHVSYSQDGTAIYTDPKTNYQYKWCTKASTWIPSDTTTTSVNPYENEHYKWCNETQKWIPKQQTQLTETEHYKWDAEKNQWIAKVKESTNDTQQTNLNDIVYEIDGDGQRTYTDKDGTVFFWDADKNAWFPKIDEDFMARYQMNYGFIDNTSESERKQEKRDLAVAEQKAKELAQMVAEAKAHEEASKESAKQGVKRKGQQEPPKWFEIDAAHNTKVYVSNLPLDITLDEFADVMGKCGMIMRDPQTQKYKLKLYTEADGQIKGDGLCDYIKVESVDLALKILDEYELRGHKMKVQRAQFQMRGEYNPALKPKRKKKDKEKLAKIKEKLFDWRPEKMRGERSKHEKTVIIKNLFHPELFEKEVQLILDYQNDLREECSKCGTVRKVVIYDRHSEGVAQINMSSPEEADLVIQMMNGRYFGKRQLTAQHWDGKTKYKIEETEEEIQKRLNKWDQYLETEENKKSDAQKQEKVIDDSPIQPESDPDSLTHKEIYNEAEVTQNVESSMISEE